MAIKTLWLNSAAAAAFLIGAPIASHAAANPIPPAITYADLLSPVPDASARLAADDHLQMQAAHLELAQYDTAAHHHHHHHHHSARWYRTNGYRWNGAAWVLVPRSHHHHHHHSRQWYSANGYYWNGRAWVLQAHHHHHHHSHQY